jgi:hypothetical protein
MTRPTWRTLVTGLLTGAVLAGLVVLALTWSALDAQADLDANRAGVIIAVDLVGGVARASLEVGYDGQAEGWALWPIGRVRRLCRQCR